MDGEELEKGWSGGVISEALSGEELARCFSRRSDLTYRKMTGVEVSGADIYQSLLTGSLIRDCVFTRVVFSRSDLDGVRAERTVFVECDFSHCDIRSSIFSRCEFKSCIFDSALVDDTEFAECVLIDCSLRSTLTTRCRFRRSSLDACVMSPGSFLHNKLYGSSIANMVLGDCTLLYVVLRDCSLTHVSINAESVGAIFGLTREQLSQADMVYLGEKQLVPPDADVIGLVYEEYRKRQWHIGQLVLAINFELASTLGAFDDYLAASFRRFAELGFAKGDELEFLGDLLQELATLERLPLLSALNVLEWCTNLEGTLRRNAHEMPDSSLDSLHTLASRASHLTNTLLDRLEQSLGGVEFGEPDRPMCVKAVFAEEPAQPLHELLAAVGGASKLRVTDQTRFIRAEAGSYVEVVYTTLFTLLAFKVFLFLVNGCIIQITEMRYRLQVLARKSPPKDYMQLVLSPSQRSSPFVLTMLQGIVKYSNALAWLKLPSLSGYSAPNVRGLQEVKCEPSAGTSTTV